MSTFNYLVRELFELFQYSSHIAISVLQLFIAETNLLIPIRYTSFEILVRNRCRHIILLKRKSNNTHNFICVSLSLSLSLSPSLSPKLTLAWAFAVTARPRGWEGRCRPTHGEWSWFAMRLLASLRSRHAGRGTLPWSAAAAACTRRSIRLGCRGTTAGPLSNKRVLKLHLSCKSSLDLGRRFA